MTRSGPHRGFTLVELLVTLLVTAIIAVGIFGAARAQQQAYTDGQRLRTAQASARSALLYLEQRLATAGLGLSPSLAFDFGRYGGPCPLSSCTRDATDNADEIVLYSRDPRYWVGVDAAVEPRGRAWPLVRVDGDTAYLKARLGDTFRAGQILQAVCPGAADYAYFTVSTTVQPLTAANAEQPLALKPVLASEPFQRQDLALSACFHATPPTARVYLVDRYRFHVRPVTASGQTVPYLVLDTGTDTDLDGDVDADDELIVAAGIESIQFAYTLTNGREVGATSGTPITFASGFPGAPNSTDQLTRLAFPGTVPVGQTTYAPTSWYGYALGSAAPERLTDHQANIRQVRVAIVARSADAEVGATGTGVLLPLNQSARPSWAGTTANDGYQRVLFESRVALPNMVVRGMTFF